MATPLDALKAHHSAYARLHDFLSDMIEGGRLKEADIPDDYRALVEQLAGPCAAADEHAEAALAMVDRASDLLSTGTDAWEGEEDSVHEEHEDHIGDLRDYWEAWHRFPAKEPAE